MKKYQIIFVTAVAVFMVFSSVLYADEDDSIALIQKFQKAVFADNKKAELKFWKKIKDDPQTVEILRKSYPDLYAVYNLRGTAVRVEALRKKYSGKAKRSVDRSEDVGSRKPHLTNRRSVRTSTYSNRDVIRRSRSHYTNRDTTRRTSNQSYPSNQKRLRSRRR